MRAQRSWGERFISGLFVFAWEAVVVALAAVASLIIAVVVLALV